MFSLTCVILAGVLGLSAPVTAAEDPRPQDESDRPQHQDIRFDNPLSFGSRTVVGTYIVQVLSRATGASFLVEEAFLRQPLPPDMDGKPAREAADLLAERFEASWQRIGDLYVFRVDQALPAIMALSDEERSELGSSLLPRILASLSPGELAILHQSGRLGLGRRTRLPAAESTIRTARFLAYASKVGADSCEIRIKQAESGFTVELRATSRSGTTVKIAEVRLPPARP